MAVGLAKQYYAPASTTTDSGPHSYPVIRTINVSIQCPRPLIYPVPDCHHYYLVILNAYSYLDIAKYRVVFLTGPPNFQYQNEKTCSANEELFYIENFVKN